MAVTPIVTPIVVPQCRGEHCDDPIPLLASIPIGVLLALVGVMFVAMAVDCWSRDMVDRVFCACFSTAGLMFIAFGASMPFWAS